ncbi:hypothetical protein BD779DRAFT_1612370 [Infundibulicybe gibba]|nr:hypothetical protein BD779DRAFT_1612370 [Infundibulicybe gibba]
MSDILTLILEPDNPCNTSIMDEDGSELMYRVSTEHGKETVTRVKNAAGEVIASWEWKDVRSDIITLGNGTPVPTSTWLRKSMIPFKDTVTFQGFSGRKYKWKGNGPGMQFELYMEADKAQPIARFQKSRHIKNRSARLLIDERGQEIQDMIVVSFLVLEKSRRARENSTINRADAIGIPMSGPLGGSS